MSSLGSAPVPPLSAADRVRGPEDAPAAIVYGDFECPYCAMAALRLRDAPLRYAFRHFPVRAGHPRAWPAACAAEAAAQQDAFWAMHDALFADQGRLEDPHLWERAAQLGLDLERFEAARRSEQARAAVQADFEGGVRAGVVSTPAIFLGGRMLAGRSGVEELIDGLS